MSSTPHAYPHTATVIDCDLRGQMCPSTLLSALREVNTRRRELRSRAVTLCFRTDNREATVTIPDAMQNMGYEVAVVRRGAHYEITVTGVPRGR